MKRLRPTDGSAQHRKTAKYHMGACRQPGNPLFAQLRAEMSPKVADLKAKQRAVEDAEDELADASAVADFAEIATENAVRDLHADLGKLDRSQPALQAQTTVMPDGFGPLIDPEGEDQFAPLTLLRKRLAPFASQPILAESIARLDEAEPAFREAVKAEQDAAERVEDLFGDELEARRQIREQLESAYGRLRDLYRSRPGMAEYYFKRGPSRRTKTPATPVTTPPTEPAVG